MSRDRKRSSRTDPHRSRRSDRHLRHPLRVESIAAGGEGVGRLEDGRVAFVHGTAPGELVEIRLTRTHARWARGRLLQVVEPSPVRRPPPCPFAGECGGCTLEHLTYEAQLAAKSRIVADALQRIGHLAIESPDVVASPHQHRYRNRVTFALRRLGTRKVVAGFHALGDPDRIVDVDGRCLLPEEPISLVWDRIRASWGPDANRLPSGEQLRLTLRATEAGRVSLIVEGGFSPGKPEELIALTEGLVSVWHRPGSDPPELLAGDPHLHDSCGNELVDLGGAAFLQVNRSAAALLDRHVLELAGDPTGRKVIDAYCGIGLHARRLARAGAFVVGLELDPAAVSAANEAAIPGAEFVLGDVAERLPEHLPADLLIVNPPRAGVAPEVCEAVLSKPPERMIYISCNPATLARDLARVRPAYTVTDVRSFDLFPQTAHVETVVGLLRVA